MSNPKRQHYIPRSVLNRFGIRSGKNKCHIHQWDKSDAAIRRVSTKDAAVTDNLYTISGDDPYAIEKELSKVETRMSSLVRKILAGTELDDDDFGNLLHFAVLLYLRGYHKIEASKEMFAWFDDQAAKVYEKQGFYPTNLEPFPKDVDPHKFAMTMSLSFTPQMFDEFSKREWCFWRAEKWDFVMNDQPLVMGFRNPPGFMESPALASDNTILFVPITRNLLMVGGLPHLPDRFTHGDIYTVSDAWVGYHNELAITQAHRFFFTPNPDFLIALGERDRRNDMESMRSQRMELFLVDKEEFVGMVQREILAVPEHYIEVHGDLL